MVNGCAFAEVLVTLMSPLDCWAKRRLAETESGSLADLLGREERLEDRIEIVG